MNFQALPDMIPSVIMKFRLLYLDPFKIYLKICLYLFWIFWDNIWLMESMESYPFPHIYTGTGFDEWNIFFLTRIFILELWNSYPVLTALIQLNKDFHRIIKGFKQPLLELILYQICFSRNHQETKVSGLFLNLAYWFLKIPNLVW